MKLPHVASLLPPKGAVSAFGRPGATDMPSTEPSAAPGFRLPRLCLPRPGIDLSRWAVVACDQYTSEPGCATSRMANSRWTMSTAHLKEGVCVSSLKVTGEEIW